MEKILFSHSYFLRFDPKQWETGLPYPPLGTLYAAALMREKGFQVAFFDTMFAMDPDELTPVIEVEKPSFFVIYDDGFNYLTKMCLTNMRDAAFRMSKLAKQHGCKVIISSSDSTDHFEKYLSEGADFILLGEAELTLLELISAISGKREELQMIPGLAYRQGEEIIKTTRRNVLRDLDELPFPAWDLLNIDPYRRSWLKNAGYFSINMASTRGCPYKCNWCAKPIYGNRYNTRSPGQVVNELRLLKEKFQFDHVWFCDDIFGLKPGWVQEFSGLVEKSDLRFKFKIQCRADLLLQENYIDALARAGCSNIWIGAESGSQKILDAMEKGTRVEQIYKATKLLKKHGIHPSFFIQFGYPGESMEDIALTIRMINELLPYEIGISVSYPLPGTVFYEKVKGELKEKSNWEDSNELLLMFRNTYPPAFYRQLHRYVHRSYRKHVAFENFRSLFRNPVNLRFSILRKALSGLYYIPASFLEKRKLQGLEKSE
jgi:anaerobic magnesium-protoporphyrin IX monomethyl ester cyclase